MIETLGEGERDRGRGVVFLGKKRPLGPRGGFVEDED